MVQGKKPDYDYAVSQKKNGTDKKPLQSLLQRVSIILVMTIVAVSLMVSGYTGAFFTDEKPLPVYTYNIDLYRTICAYMGVFVNCHNKYQLKIMIPPQTDFNLTEINTSEIICEGLTVNGAPVVTGDSAWQEYKGCLYGNISLCDIQAGPFTWPHPLVGLYKLKLSAGFSRFDVLGQVYLILPGFGGFSRVEMQGDDIGMGVMEFFDQNDSVEKGALPEMSNPEWNLPEWELPAWDYPGWYFPELDHPGEDAEADVSEEAEDEDLEESDEADTSPSDDGTSEETPSDQATSSQSPEEETSAPPSQSPEEETSVSPSQSPEEETSAPPSESPGTAPGSETSPPPKAEAAPEPDPNPDPEPAPPPLLETETDSSES